MIGQQLGPYRIESELGSGGMGMVYLAEAVEAAAGLEPGTKIALKVVHPHLLETPGFFKRFMQEAELGKRVRHENVVRTFDVDAIGHEGQQHHYMVMEYVQGKSLRELLNDLGTIPETLLREVALQTTAGRFRRWELTQDKAHLEEAHRLLCYARDHAPEEDRDSMIENVPPHRDIMKAWEEHGAT